MDPITGMLLSFVVVIILGYLFITRNYTYWIKRNINFEKPKFFFGSMYDMTFGKRHISDTLNDIYWKYPESSVVGMFSYTTPMLLLRDPELARDVLIKSFHSFHDNDFEEDIDPVFKYNPFLLKGDRWKKTRSRLTLGFTSAKIRCLIPSMKEVCNGLVDYLSKHPGSIDARELAGKYTTDIVALSVCGINGHSFLSEDPEFRKMGRQIFGSDSLISNVTMTMFFFMPKLAKFLRLRIVPKDVEKFFKILIKDAIKYRESNSINRNDFLQLLMSMEESNEDFHPDELLSHVISFFTDGVETSGGAMSFAIYLLALNPDKQALAQEEVDKIWEKYGDFVPDALEELRYIENCILEGLRIFPPASFMKKLCTKNQELPLGDGKNLTIERNLNVVISIRSLHHDPNYFPDPEKFIPERHEEDQKSDLSKKAFLPFGEGPRMCIGKRFAMTQIKIGLAYILKNFNIVPVRETPKKITYHPRQIVSTSNELLYVGFKKR